MPKRGDRLPWRVSFEWGNGVKGSVPCYDTNGAQTQISMLRAHAEAKGVGLTLTVTNRDTDFSATQEFPGNSERN